MTNNEKFKIIDTKLEVFDKGYKITMSSDICIFNRPDNGEAMFLKNSKVNEYKSPLANEQLVLYPNYQKYIDESTNYFFTDEGWSIIDEKTIFSSDEGGIARKFKDMPFVENMNINDINSEQKDKIIEIANKYGLLEGDYYFDDPNLSRLVFSRKKKCDLIANWYATWEKVYTILYVIENFKKIKLEDFKLEELGDDIWSVWFSINKVSIKKFDEDLQQYIYSFSMHLHNFQLNEIKMKKPSLVILKEELLSNIIYDLNTEIRKGAYVNLVKRSDKMKGVNNKYEYLVFPKNLKGAIFIDLAMDYTIDRKIGICPLCNTRIDKTNCSSNKNFHKKCYQTFKKRVTRLREKGKTDQEIAKSLNVEIKYINLRKYNKKTLK